MKGLLLLLLLVLLPASFTAAQVSDNVGRRLYRILEQSAEDPATALAELTDYLESPRLSETDRGYIMREKASLLIREQRYDQARSELAAILEGKPEDYVPQLRVLYGQLLLMDNDSEGAIRELEIWVREGPAAQRGELSLLGYAYAQVERFEEAAEIFEQLIAEAEQEEGDVSDMWVEILAYTYTRLDRSDDAITLIENTISAQPANARWWRQLSRVFLIMEDVENGTASMAVTQLLEDLEFEDSRRLALLFNMLRLPDDGARILEAAIELKAEEIDFEDRMLLGELWVLAREFDKAVAEFQRAIPLTETGEPQLKISQLHLQWERYSEARDYLQSAIEAYGEEAPEQLYYLLAITEINLDNLDQAGDALRRIDDEGDYAERADNLDLFIQNRLRQLSAAAPTTQP